ncbi:adenine phosphoribosyltransferase [Xanthomonas translucens]|uniref:Adenine phosphoribosyltransferase n=3 Tax=Xanthomonas campestris pv. translucens TaxID=343 RepID=A0A109HJZ4_XANCT|nr:adenine phosphoribosyltransferase [Xanthomonas translucens]KTF36709.1 adenine phosphoribosyltransferase [Xanthomonas translucens pv. translucens]KWV13575.1 adenine phosphoribosyltransferase [Xanthomonas translucens]KWV15780.1 adenine phosphoribosyltransferase [Xanthomonas translucens]MCC8444980.1 adenine phosphoribosyltransferase [Xanthomonas translucens pv. translucens]MCS3359396.1 adenine phosphoribosyltransferase [Xanthomonas translucens pv. translucens]
MNDSSCCGGPSDAPAHWSGRIRDIADFPKPGIVFKDITPLLADGPDFASALDEMARPWRTTPLDAVLGIESRGFILGAALAHELRTGFVPIRKPGKLPGRTVTQDYTLEYGSDRIEMHADALPAGARVLIVDDVLATGGTLCAALALARQLQLEIVGAVVLVELQALQGRERWSEDVPLLATLTY